MKKQLPSKILVVVLFMGGVFALLFQNCAKSLNVDDQNLSSNLSSPVLGSYPLVVSVQPGQILSLTVPSTPAGSNYNWFFTQGGQGSEILIQSGMSDTYSIPNASTANSGIYRISVSNIDGNAGALITVNVTTSAQVTVTPPPNVTVPAGCPGAGVSWVAAQIYPWCASMSFGTNTGACMGGIYVTNGYSYWVARDYNPTTAHNQVKNLTPGPGAGCPATPTP